MEIKIYKPTVSLIGVSRHFKGELAGRLVSVYRDQDIEKLQSLPVILILSLATKWTTEIDLGSTGL